jgi:bifunctional non-homologous end joining protein LigD
MIGVSDADKPDKLARYRQKRDPGRTTEPFAPEPLPSAKPGGAGAGATWGGAFVVHEHDATRKHYDLRLEVGGVLKSFAVPRGPSLDPEEKRLAVETEDHPFEYLEYEGVIPERNYGAGAMIAWDLGRVRYLEQSAEDGLKKGKVDFELQGYKLRGRFALVLTSGRKGEAVRQRQWLLLKKRDAHARPGSDILEDLQASVLSGLKVSELEGAAERAQGLEREAHELGATKRSVDGASLVPMACATEGAPLESPDYLYELKLDGVRILADKRGDEVALYYRKGRVGTAGYPDVVRALRALPFERLILDGEIIAFDETGRPNFQRLAQRFQAARPRDVERAMRVVPVSFVAFDLLALGAQDLSKLPLVERKQLLKRALPSRGVVSALDHIEDDGRALYEFCRVQRLEGLVAKRKASPYRVGPKASNDWVKVKADREDDFVVIGYTRGNVGRELGALDLASYRGDQLVSRGKVGSGFDGPTLELLIKELEKRRVKSTDVSGELTPAPRGRTFVRPDLVVNVRYTGFTDDAHLRHPVYRGLRADVAPRDCTAGPHLPLEQALPEVAPAAADEPRKAPGEPAKLVAGGPGKAAAAKRRVSISNPKKVFWPQEGYTKFDLCHYYESMADVLLPLLRERPVILVRYPDGIEGKSFYQWNAPQGTPSWVRTVKVRWEDRDNKEVELFLIDELDTLLYIANLGCIPLHILAARMGALSTCDFFTVDFDLGGQPLSHAITLARELKQLLDQTGLRGYPKTSGQSGLHVLVPLGPAIGFDTARALCELLGTLVAARHPTLATVERNKSRRGPRVYVDTGQTGTLRAIVAPYSVRAYPGARVSTPLTWDEVSFALEPARFTIFTVPERVATIGDPMADFLEQTPDIPSVVEALRARLPTGR